MLLLAEVLLREGAASECSAAKGQRAGVSLKRLAAAVSLKMLAASGGAAARGLWQAEVLL